MSDVFRPRKTNKSHCGSTLISRSYMASFEGREMFTPAQMAKFKEQFSRYDTDGDGKISGTELGPLMESLGLETSAREVKAFLKATDTDQNGAIEFNEFVSMMAKKAKRGPLLLAFKTFDKNGDGFISLDELRKGLKASGDAVTEMELSFIMARADTDGDGKVNYEEFVAMMSN